MDGWLTVWVGEYLLTLRQAITLKYNGQARRVMQPVRWPCNNWKSVLSTTDALLGGRVLLCTLHR